MIKVKSDEPIESKPVDLVQQVLDHNATKTKRRPNGNPKTLVTLRIDPEVIEAFKFRGEGWQSRMNDVLRAAAIGDAIREELPLGLEESAVTVGTRSAQRIISVRTGRSLSDDERHSIVKAATDAAKGFIFHLDFSIET